MTKVFSNYCTFSPSISLSFMKKIFMLLGFLACISTTRSQSLNFLSYPVYNGNDLGMTYSPQQTKFRIWAPTAMQALVRIYPYGDVGNVMEFFPMKKDKDGTWVFTWKGDHKGAFYAFSVYIDGKWMDDVADPYAKIVGVNGKRAMIADLKETDPPGWEKDKSPAFSNKTDAIIYELHVRDASMARNSGIRANGKFAGLTEKGTKNSAGLSTGLDHIRELGVTHVHLLPVYDFNSIDETKHQAPYNWGYDPLNYNTPEGSYASDAYDGTVRIKEFKDLIKTFHENGLRVVMDVVYNHTALTEKSNFNQLVPGYYYRQTKDGKFSNASACGNETASDRPMMRKFMLESMKYWVQEYHIDGFRVDLMGIHDIATMNLISKELHKIKPDILLYGEGWTAGASPLPDSLKAIKANAYKLDRIAVFSDDIRDGIKGSVFEHEDKGFATGKPGMEESVKFGIVASLKHPQVDYSKVNYSKKPYAEHPWHTVTYCECHDNHVLWDKLLASHKGLSLETIKQMHQLSLSIVLTSQGISFLHAGTEFLRTKYGVENSFESPDSINAINWDLKTMHEDVYDYVRALVKMRKEHPAFRMTKATDIASAIRFQEGLPGGVIAYTINGSKVNDKWKKILVCFNGSNTMQRVEPGEGEWINFINDNRTTEPVKQTGTVTLQPYSCSILYSL